ncbi:hypothetical protein TKK_0001106 [Trichogramma kaykai]|uniref:RNA helicase n=1 Tax=Trichogramma kaykai TaxID=54128 RepID=A0ABD2WTY5_9HYME
MSDVQESSDNEETSINGESSIDKELSIDGETSVNEETLTNENTLVNEEIATNEVTWKDLGLNDVMLKAVENLKWEKPSLIQQKAIPPAIEGKDIIGLAETGSGKTASFALPIVQALLKDPQRYFALVLTPTRELAFQISEQFTAIGSMIGLKCAVIVGGLEMKTQVLQLSKKPHIIVAAPGRLVDHLKSTKGFNLRSLKYLVLDEADRLLSNEFEKQLNTILRAVPRERKTMLFSATMTKKVHKLQRASLKDPVKVEVSTTYQTVEKLKQYYMFMPGQYKEVYLVHLLTQLQSEKEKEKAKSVMIFCFTCERTMRVAKLLCALGFKAVPLHGQMVQNKRIAALNKFKAKDRPILVSTDVASRGLDIPHVDAVINFDVPTHSKDYIHRVGRTARAGRKGLSVTFSTQYDLELFLNIEKLIEKKMELYPHKEEDVMSLLESVMAAQKLMVDEKSQAIEDKKMGRKRKPTDNDFENDIDKKAKFKKSFKGKNKKRRIH